LIEPVTTCSGEKDVKRWITNSAFSNSPNGWMLQFQHFLTGKSVVFDSHKRAIRVG